MGRNLGHWVYNPPAGPMRRGPDAGLALLYKTLHHACLLGSYMCTPPCCPSALEKTTMLRKSTKIDKE